MVRNWHLNRISVILEPKSKRTARFWKVKVRHTLICRIALAGYLSWILKLIPFSIISYQLKAREFAGLKVYIKTYVGIDVMLTENNCTHLHKMNADLKTTLLV